MTTIAGRVVTPRGVLDPGWVLVRDGRIDAVGEGSRPDADLAADWVLPGFVDLHVHGGGGTDFQSGDPADVARVVELHRAHGTTTMLASLVTAPLGELARATAALAELVTDGLIAGVHLEGPFLAAARCGAHDPALLRPPARDDLERLLAAGRGTVRMVTVAPELDGGPAAVELLAGNGVVAAVGHTDASYEQTASAVRAGATVATHLCNGMRGVHHREPGPVLALLEDERVVVELINDGVHLHPAVIRSVLCTVGPRRVALITDAMAAAGAGDGDYLLGGRPVHVRDGVARLAAGDAVAGSTLTLDEALRRTVAAGVPLPDAARALATTPATVLGLDTGAVEPGLAADLVLLDEHLTVRTVLARGVPVA
ncbi:MAG TPA: N-acetylglucosamine-6-phosphate deacetylase [Pseudonocardiaceae bacterium]